MNLALLDSELFELPEIIEDKLTVPDEMAVVAFNARGNMLAAGCMNGAVAVFDFETHGEPRVIMRGHTGRCTSVSWTRSSRKILSSSVDGKLMVWDVLSSTAVQVIELGHEVLTAALHPRSRSLCLALVGSGGAGQVYLVPLQPATQPPVALMQPAESQARPSWPCHIPTCPPLAHLAVCRQWSASNRVGRRAAPRTQVEMPNLAVMLSLRHASIARAPWCSSARLEGAST